jgi:hypothetical protein
VCCAKCKNSKAMLCEQHTPSGEAPATPLREGTNCEARPSHFPTVAIFVCGSICYLIIDSIFAGYYMKKSLLVIFSVILFASPLWAASTDLTVRGSGRLFPIAVPQLCLQGGDSEATRDIPRIIGRDLDRRASSKF